MGTRGPEALYPGNFTDATGKPLSGANGAQYMLRFAKDALPPANAFWSITMYDGKTKLLIDNPADRYLINSRMLNTLARDADGGITLNLQHGKPGAERQANWLAAPDGPFYVIPRLYMPKAQATGGKWKQPPLAKAQ